MIENTAGNYCLKKYCDNAHYSECQANEWSPNGDGTNDMTTGASSVDWPVYGETNVDDGSNNDSNNGSNDNASNTIRSLTKQFFSQNFNGTKDALHEVKMAPIYAIFSIYENPSQIVTWIYQDPLKPLIWYYTTVYNMYFGVFERIYGKLTQFQTE